MVDLNTCPPTPPPHIGGGGGGGGTSEHRSKIKSFMGRTPGIGMLKSKFLTVLGNSNELLNGISNKLTLSISSSDSEYCDDDEEDLPVFDETIDYTKIDFESRRVKARRAHEEIISGRYRHPNLAPRPRLETIRDAKHAKSSSMSSSSSPSSSSSSSSHSLNNLNLNERSHVSSTTRSNSTESRHSWGYGRPGRAIAGARRSDLDIQKDLARINELLNTSSSMGAPHIDVQPPSDRTEQHLKARAHDTIHTNAIESTTTSIKVPTRSRISNSSTITSLRDDPEIQVSPSVESTDWRHFIRSESQNSVPSWASSISLDCRAGEEPIKEFMKKFTENLFGNASAISLELKSEFGAMSRLEHGRQWFTRFLLEQKIKSKRVDEITFHSLVQYFAIVLFECSEFEDYSPAAVIMNLCFLFYHDIEVPGCDPYRQYLFIFMRQQPIWHTLRFWNAAFFEAVQSEREHRLAVRVKRAEKRQKAKELKAQKTKPLTKAIESAPVDIPKSCTIDENNVKCIPKGSSSSSSSHHTNVNALANGSICSAKAATSIAVAVATTAATTSKSNAVEIIDKEQLSEIRMQENITFRQLGAFTCNMHSLGIPQELCLEFLKKQSASLNLPNEKTKLIKDNVQRMYHETDLWGAKES